MAIIAIADATGSAGIGTIAGASVVVAASGMEEADVPMPACASGQSFTATTENVVELDLMIPGLVRGRGFLFCARTETTRFSRASGTFLFLFA
jgi:hypothetical protein